MLRSAFFILAIIIDVLTGFAPAASNWLNWGEGRDLPPLN
jgi:hypothetical protein